MSTRRVLFIFLDGVGIGPDDPDRNPFLRASLPRLRALLDDRVPTLQDPACGTEGAWVIPTDALLGIEGTPQSGTGQTALLTGQNAPALFGRHFGPWVPVRLKPLLAQGNLFTRAQASGLSCAFANAYPSQFQERAWSRRPAGPPLAAHAAGLLTRDENELAAGLAVSSEITNAAWRTRLGLTHLPVVTPRDAGRNLADIAAAVHLTFFAHYCTDTAGHEREMDAAVRSLEKVDRFLDGVLAGLSPTTLLVLSSDHGNLEETNLGHTQNPVFTLLVGTGARELGGRLVHITDVPGLILDFLLLPSLPWEGPD